MTYSFDFSVIVPCWRGAVRFLPKLLDSIPNKSGIEIIVVDNSIVSICREEVDSERDILLLHSAPDRHAGGSRNEGIAAARGRWLLFADADDYYTPDAFDIYYSMLETDAEIVYTGMGGLYEDTGNPSDRGDTYTRMVHQYCMGELDEYTLRLNFSSPCCKMVSHDLVNRYNIRYDEIRAGNDAYFSLLTGYYAQKIAVVDKITYIATVNRGSLTKRLDYEVVRSRLYSKLHCNEFLREKGFSNQQHSVMYALVESRRFGLSKTWEFICMIVKFHQNPFVGIRNWGRTLFKKSRNRKKDDKYIIK